MDKFKKGDKVKPSKFYGKGNDYFIGTRYYTEVQSKHKFLTVRRYAKNAAGCDFVWFREVECYWPPQWFEKADTQLEFNFNEK
jgi:hypothetical protein